MKRSTIALLIVLAWLGCSGFGGFSPFSDPAGNSVDNATIDSRITQGTSAKALALNANGANCSAGQAPLGVDASGAVEGCWTPGSDGNDTEINRLIDADHASSTETITGSETAKSVTPKALLDALAAYTHAITTTAAGTFGSLSVGTNDNATISDNGTIYITALQLKRSATADTCQEFYGRTGSTDYYRQYCAPPAGYATSNLRINYPTALPTAGQVEAYGAPADGLSTKTFVLPALSPAAGQVTFAGPTQARTVTLPDAAISFAGTMTDGKYCTYASSGAVISCNSTPAGTGDFLADGTVPMTGAFSSTHGGMSLGVADTTDGILTLYGDDNVTGPTIVMMNAANEDATEEGWVYGPAADTRFDLGTIDSTSLFKFYNSGNFAATGNVVGATYGSDASISDTELKTLDDGALTEILVGGGAGSAPVWTTATGTGAPVRGTGPAITAGEVLIDCNGSTDPYAYCTSANASTLTATEVSRTIINSYGRGEAQTVTLPTAAAGMTFIVIVGTQHNSAFTIAKGASSLYWETAGVPTAVAAFLEANQVVGSRASCATFKTGASAWSWVCGGISGTWTTTAL